MARRVRWHVEPLTMSLPALVQASFLRPVQSAAVAVPPPPVPPPPLVSVRVLGLAMQTQARSEWCWAAVAVSVAAWFVPMTTWTQCKLAGLALRRVDCCSKRSGVACNRWWYLDRVLGRIRHLDRWDGRPATEAEVQTAINAGTPVCCRILWNGGPLAHFVAVDGYSGSAPNMVVTVRDPFWGTFAMQARRFTSAYRNSGTWVETTFTKP